MIFHTVNPFQCHRSKFVNVSENVAIISVARYLVTGLNRQVGGVASNTSTNAVTIAIVAGLRAPTLPEGQLTHLQL